MTLQLDLPLKAAPHKSKLPYKAWARSGMALPYDPALREHAIALWLRKLADSMRSEPGVKRRG